MMNKRKRLWIGAATIVVSFSLYFAYTYFKQSDTLAMKSKETKRIEAQIEEEKKTNKRLTEQSKNVNSDEYNEKVAREKLGMVKQGERIFVDIND